MADKKEETIIIAHETMWESLVSDGVTYLGLLAVIVFAWWLDNTFISGFGACVWLLGLFTRWAAAKRRSPAEAVKYLREKYGVE